MQRLLKGGIALGMVLGLVGILGCPSVGVKKAYRGKMDVTKVVAPGSVAGMKSLVVQVKAADANNPDLKRMGIAVERGLKLHAPAKTNFKTVIARSELRQVASVPKKVALLTIETTSFSKPGFIDLSNDGLKFKAKLEDPASKTIIGEGIFFATAQEDKVNVGAFKVSGSNPEEHNVMENSAHFLVKWLQGED